MILKGCPFCGEEENLDIAMDKVTCLSCEAQGPPCADGQVNAPAEWNLRTESVSPAQDVFLVMAEGKVLTVAASQKLADHYINHLAKPLLERLFPLHTRDLEFIVYKRRVFEDGQPYSTDSPIK